MLHVLRQDNHLPGRCKNGFIALGLPKLNIKLPVSRLSTHNPCLEVSLGSLTIFSLQRDSLLVPDFWCHPWLSFHTSYQGLYRNQDALLGGWAQPLKVTPAAME